jgi:MFS family permease
LATTEKLLQNIWKLYLVRISKWFMLFMPVVVLFIQSNGLDLRGVMLVNAVYAVTVAVFEIPSGYFSDRLGRKNAIIIGTILILGQFIAYSFATSFLGFAVGAFLGGIGVSFISGTDAALLYDTLVAVGAEKAYVKWEGRSYAVGTFAEAVAAILGGWLAAYYGLRFTIYAQVGVSLMGVIVATTLVEPSTHRVLDKKESWALLKVILRETFRENKKLLFYLFLSAVVGLACLLLAWFVQPYFTYHVLGENYMGYLWALLNGIVAVFSANAYLLQRSWKDKQLVTILLSLLIIGYFILGFCGNYWTLGIGVLCVMYAARGIAVPVFANLINKEITADRRATVLSIKGFGIRLIFAILAPILGWVADVFSILETFTLLGLIIGVFVFFLAGFYWWIKEKKE